MWNAPVVGNKPVRYPFSHVAIAPAGEAHVHPVPVPQKRRQVVPVYTYVVQQKHGFDKAARVARCCAPAVDLSRQ